MRNGREIAQSVDPNTSQDVCTFCHHARSVSLHSGVDCGLGHYGYFRSLSNVGPIFVSDCRAGKLKPELDAVDKNRVGRALSWQLWRKTTGEWVLSNSDNAGNGRAVELSNADAAPLIAAMAAALVNQK